MPYAADSLIAKILGPCATVSSIAAMGGDPNKWVTNFKQYEPGHYTTGKAQGTNYWATSNYYDRAKIYYQWHVGEAVNAAAWLTKANELALNYRDTYVPPGTGGGVSAHWSMPVGVALHGILNNDAKSKSWLDEVATNFSAPYYVNGLGDINGEMDNRMQARCLESWLLAWLINGQNAKWADCLRKGLTDILKTQRADGAYPFAQVQNGGNKPFMVGLLNDAMLFYSRAFEADARIADSVKRACDYMWAKNWLPASKTFIYTEGMVDEGPASDLNPLIIGGFIASGGWDARANDILAGSMSAWLQGDKQFNQSYTSEYASLAKRANAVSAWTGGVVTPPVQPPATIDVAGIKVDLNNALTAIGKGQTALADATKAINAALAKLPK